MEQKFHDRSITFETIDENGIATKHIYDLSGGLDKIDESREFHSDCLFHWNQLNN